jgi:hypothetical protein
MNRIEAINREIQALEAQIPPVSEQPVNDPHLIEIDNTLRQLEREKRELTGGGVWIHTTTIMDELLEPNETEIREGNGYVCAVVKLDPDTQEVVSVG